MGIGRLDHYSIRTPDVGALQRFYTEVMGLTSGPRPPFNFPGAWLYSGQEPDATAVVHIIGVDRAHPDGLKDYLGDQDPASSAGTGNLDHIAFRAEGLSEMRERCGRLGVPFRERTVPNLGLHQVFLKDPSGVTIELNYPATEA